MSRYPASLITECKGIEMISKKKPFSNKIGEQKPNLGRKSIELAFAQVKIYLKRICRERFRYFICALLSFVKTDRAWRTKH